MSTHYSLERFDEVTSTQDVVRDHAPRTPHAVIANRQTAGRGRHGRTWETAPRAVAVSVGWETMSPETSLLPLLGGLAAHRLIDGKLKWPNDVIVGGKKVAGVLAERSGGLVIIGMGVNLWWPHPPPGQGAIWDDVPEEDAGFRLGKAWVEGVLELVDQRPWPRTEYKDACDTVGRHITWEPSGSGRAVDISPLGALVVETSSGREEIHSGEVRNVR